MAGMAVRAPQGLKASGFEVIQSVCNVLVVRFGDATDCQAAQAAWADHGVLAMPLTGYDMHEALRITVGTEAANRAVASALTGTST